MRRSVEDTRYLWPIHENKRSYYGKAIIQESNSIMELYSFGEHVATIYKNKGSYPVKAEVYDNYKNTTYRHVKEFLRQNWFEAKTKEQIQEYIIKK